ncbi:hypothetical protein RFI_40127, partial [Reticulomyxa filosa]
IRVFNGHKRWVNVVEYSPFVIKNSIDNSNVMCSGSDDNTIRFWDIRSNKDELYVIKGDDEDGGIVCLKFLQLKKYKKKIKINDDIGYGINLCYSSSNGLIRIWGYIFIYTFNHHADSLLSKLILMTKCIKQTVEAKIIQLCCVIQIQILKQKIIIFPNGCSIIYNLRNMRQRRDDLTMKYISVKINLTHMELSIVSRVSSSILSDCDDPFNAFDLISPFTLFVLLRI